VVVSQRAMLQTAVSADVLQTPLFSTLLHNPSLGEDELYLVFLIQYVAAKSQIRSRKGALSIRSQASLT